MFLGFTSFSTVFQLYQEDGRVFLSTFPEKGLAIKMDG